MAKGFGYGKIKTGKNSNRDYIDFLINVLDLVSKYRSDDYIVYSFLLANLDKLDDNFVEVLKNWATINLSQETPQNAYSIASAIGNFSTVIEQFTKGKKDCNVEIAITGYNVIARVFTRVNFPEDWARNKNNLGVAYRKRIRGNWGENLEQAIKSYQSALEVWTRNLFPEQWAMVKNNLAAAYCYRILGDPAQNIENALIACQEALQIRTKEVDTQKWANTQNTLGSVYYKRILGNRVENLENAIFCYQAALDIYSYNKYLLNWALVKHNLGNLYSERIKGDLLENLEIAIAAFRSALTVYTQNEFSQMWATVQNSLGMTYFQRLDGDKKQNLEDAIQALQLALQVFNRDDFPLEWAKTTSNLGNIYRERIEGNLSENQKIAISNYKKSLEITNKAHPKQWAETQNNLGAAYSEMIEGNELQNLEQAVHCYQEALKIRTYNTLPKDWAMTQYNLGKVYSKLGRITEAIDCYQDVLNIYEPKTFPLECIRTGRELGNTALNTQLSSAAIYGYGKAIEAVETSRSWAKSESRRQEILEESIDIYQNIIQACINAGQIDKAFEYSERSRSKRLVDLMASNNLSQSENIPPKVQELLQQYEELQQLIDAERQKYKSENNRSETRAAWQAYNETIASLEANKQQIWENLRREDPVLAGEIQVNPLSLSEIQQLIDNPNTAILSFYTTNTDTHIFIVRQNHISLHTCTGEGLETFQNWIVHNWLLSYKEYIEENSKKWESQIGSILRELSERLQLSELINQHLQGIEELIIVPHLLLHQIPFAALPTGEYQEYLVDRFLIRYTPSCQILEFCHQRPNVEIFHETSLLQYGTVEDATDNLPCARFEGEEIAKIYNIPAEKRLIGSSQATRQNYRQLAEQVQILHSCHHAESCLYNPLESYLKLADGNITLGQLMSPGWRLPNLVDVFLSCCETNLGTTPLTDDILTLSTGFLCAGARSVVSSLWSVDDLATSLFSIFYYQQRQLGKNRPEALKHAQIKLRELRKADLAEISNQIDEKEKELIGNRKQYTRNSVEYLKWEDQYNTHTKINRLIKQKIQTSEPEFPFAHPHYWAAFVCHGLR